ncbi:NASP-related protein [Yarrowia sp. C11]|nr:NASP-related protein [Yarrowia sp. E02]KAG5367730.1 NASP-related protein [Yarrowia sp. C11]
MKQYSDEIERLTALGSKAYALKNYESATETLGQACEKYSEETGEEDGYLLFLYGRALFQAGVSSSNVLGGGETTGEVAPREEIEAPVKSSGAFQFEEAPEEEEEEEEEEGKGKEKAEEGDEEEEEEEEQAQTDFEVAWEVTDLARKLYEDELATEGVSAERVSEIEQQLGDVYDILGEISLESENFPQAVIDLGRSVELKNKHNEFQSTIMSEAHYKYSLALEFSPNDAENKQKAVDQMVLAIDSVKKRIAMTGEKDDDLVADLEIRLSDLRAIAKGQEDFDVKKQAVMAGILGNSSDDVVKNIMAAAGVGGDAQQVNDLSGLAVRKKAPKRVAPVAAEGEQSGSGEKKAKVDGEEKKE